MSDREKLKIKREIESAGGFYVDHDEYMEEYGEFFEDKDVIIKRQKTLKGEVRLYKCPHCSQVIPRAAWFEDCMFCGGAINWRRARK